ncbi:MAG: PEP-CTERM sorting domain-containing protein [Verrucomicrobiales bacterium]|nr:PEP-CTERM sorting domain-containing protein [Verrucomicrobiales bacterium]
MNYINMKVIILTISATAVLAIGGARAQVLINDTDWTGATLSGTTLSGGANAGNYLAINNNQTAITVSGSNLAINSNGGNVVYRAFDEGSLAPDKHTLSGWAVGEGLSFTVTVAINASAESSQFSLGFASDTAKTSLYVMDCPIAYNSSVKSRDSALMGQNGMSFAGTDFAERTILKDQQFHDVTFSITANGDSNYTFKYLIDSTELLNKSVQVNSVVTGYALDGIAFRGETFSYTISGVNVTVIPEPSAAVLLGVGAGLLAVTALIRRRQG